MQPYSPFIFPNLRKHSEICVVQMRVSTATGTETFRIHPANRKAGGPHESAHATWHSTNVAVPFGFLVVLAKPRAPDGCGDWFSQHRWLKPAEAG